MRANTVHRETAGLQLLSQDQCEEIYLGALEILDRVGVNVFHDEAMSLLERAGALVANPFLILYAEPSSPLQHSREALEKLLLCAQWRLPVMYVPAVMLGGTAPVTPAGGVALACAECLSGLVIHQLKAPGAPFIYGGSGPAMDMRTALCSYGSPELQLTCGASAAMAQFFDLPVFTTAGCSDAHVLDPQAGMEAGYTILFQALAGANLIHDLGYIGAGMTSSLEMLALCDEAAGVAKYLVRGLEVSAETLALEVIERVGPGGNFFAEEHTVRHFKESPYLSELSNRLEHARWQEGGAPDLCRRANDRVRSILGSHRPTPLPGEVLEGIHRILSRRGNEAAAAR